MMDIKELLNPISSPRLHRSETMPPIIHPPHRQESPFSTLSDTITTKMEKVKEARDAPKFEKRATAGQINFPAHEPSSGSMRAEMRRFNILPREPYASIHEYPRTIPYASDKRTFTAGTGREGFEVFQYAFRYTHHEEDTDESRTYDRDDAEWTILWDYNVGFVRITPLFKSQQYAKTQPAKVIDQNPGLRDMSYSITGGSIAAQGYWLPFQAAKALAFTFCWRIRYALVPIFGPDFVKQCVHPHDPAFKRWTIDSAIIAGCRSSPSVSPKPATPPKPANKRRRFKNVPDLAASALTASDKEVEPQTTSSDKKLRPRMGFKTYSISDESDDVNEDCDDSDGSSFQLASPLKAPPRDSQWVSLNSRAVASSSQSPVPAAKVAAATSAPVTPDSSPKKTGKRARGDDSVPVVSAATTPANDGDDGDGKGDVGAKLTSPATPPQPPGEHYKRAHRRLEKKMLSRAPFDEEDERAAYALLGLSRGVGARLCLQTP